MVKKAKEGHEVITIKGNITLKAGYEIELEMSEKAFSQLSDQEKKEYIQNEINWNQFIQAADVEGQEIEEVC